MALLMVVAPAPDHPQTGGLTLVVQVFPDLELYRSDQLQYRVDSPQVRDPDERGVGWIWIRALTPGQHSIALVDGGRLLCVKDVTIVPGSDVQAMALHIPREALQSKVKPKGLVVERGTWKPVAGARVTLRFPDLIVFADDQGRFQSDQEIELSRLFSVGVDAPGFKPRVLNVERIGADLVRYFRETGEVIVPIARIGTYDTRVRR